MACDLKCIGTTGFVFTIIFGVFGTVALVLTSITYNMTHFDFVDVKWGSFGSVTIVNVCIVIVIMVIGHIEFKCCLGSKGFGIFYVCIQMICVLFCMIISIICFVVGNTGKIEDFAGCNKDYKGLFKHWNNMDNLMMLIDRQFCSDKCPCDFTRNVTNIFNENTTVKPYFDLYNKDGIYEKFNDCPEEAKKEVQDGFEIWERLTGNHLTDFNITKFGEYWADIEEKFECTGWCSSSYTFENNGVNETRYLYKYLFYGINHGIVKKTGCLGSILDWIRPKLNAYAVISFICSLIGLTSWMLGIAVLCECPQVKVKKDETTVNDKNKNEEVEEINAQSNIVKVDKKK